MPNWTDENGTSRFNQLECKRCLTWFVAVRGEVPEHECHGGIYRSSSLYGAEHHTPVFVRPSIKKDVR